MLEAGLRIEVIENRLVGDVVDKSLAKGRRGNSEDYVVAVHCLIEIGLREDTAAGIAAALDGEQVVHSAVRCAIRIAHESNLADRAMQAEERRNRVFGAVQSRHRELRVDLRT